MGDPLLLNVVTDQSRLEVGGLDLDVLAGIVGNSQRQLELTGVRDEEGRAGRGRESKDKGDEEDGERLAPPGATLRPTTDKPLSRAAAELLCDLSDEPGLAERGLVVLGAFTPPDGASPAAVPAGHQPRAV